jgi:hypothetical protein
VIAVAERVAVEAAQRVVAALGGRVHAAFVAGSGSYGGFDPDASDLDVLVVWDAPLSRREKDELVERARVVDVSPARKLELVVYADGERVLNLNTAHGVVEHVTYDAGDDPAFWFVLDRAVGEQYAVPLRDVAWTDVFEPVSRAEVVAALLDSLDWYEQNEPRTAGTVLHAVRTLRWAETGDWVSKPEALAWVRDRARAALEAAP